MLHILFVDITYTLLRVCVCIDTGRPGQLVDASATGGKYIGYP